MSIQLRSPAGLRQRRGQRRSPVQGEGCIPFPGGPRPHRGSPGESRAGMLMLMVTGAGGTFWVGGAGDCLDGCRSGEEGEVLALLEGGEGARLPKPDGLDAELLNYEY